MNHDTFPLKKMMEEKNDEKFKKLVKRTLGLFLDPQSYEEHTEKKMLEKVEAYIEESI